MSDRLPSVAIVILNYNGRGFLEKFLPSVLATNYNNLQINVADNGSTDDSCEWLSNHYPQVKQIVLEKNFGFAEGYNQALKHVKTDYFVLLNSDVEVTPNWIAPVIALMESESNIGICQPKLLSYSNKTSFEYAGAAGGWMDRLGYLFARGRVFDSLEKDNGQYNDNCRVFWASGAAMFIKRPVWESLGGFDGYLFAHQEEIDLCWRAQRKGIGVYYCADSVVFHVGGGTLNKSNPQKTYLNFRNSLIILAKNLPAPQAFSKIFMRLILDGMFGTKLILSGHLKEVWAIVRAHFGFYRWLFKISTKDSLVKVNMKNLQGVVNQSIVWDYFIKGKKTFSEIVYKK